MAKLPLLVVLTVACGVVPLLRSADPEIPRKPNIVFILADDLGWSDTTLYGTTRYYETPNIQRLAQRGMLFTNAYAANPLCSPSRASIMSGNYPARIGITSAVCHLPAVRLHETIVPRAPRFDPARQALSATRLDTSYYTLAEALHGGGYVTGHYGKWHLGAEPYSPLQQGFDVDVPHWWGPGPAGCYLGPWLFPKQLHFVGQKGEHLEDRMASEAIKFITANANRPFFLNYWAFSVHAPFDGKPGLIEKYRRKADPADPQHCPVYGAMVESLDQNVGRLLDTLDELHLTQSTIIVFFSDNGGNTYDRPGGEVPTSNAPLRGGKATIYEGGTREPCIVVWPGRVKPGTRTDALLSGVDWYPTLLDMVGLRVKPGLRLDGVSQVPALLGTGEPRDTIFDYFPHYTPATGQRPAASVRRGDWKLIRYFCDGPQQHDRYELYNLKEDLGESHNLATAEPAKVRELGRLLDGFLTDTHALIPPPNPAYDPAAPLPAVRSNAAGPRYGKSVPTLRQELEAQSDDAFLDQQGGDGPRPTR